MPDDKEKYIEQQHARIESERIIAAGVIKSLDADIKFYSRFAWFLIILGAVVLIATIIPFYLTPLQNQKLNLYGDLVGGLSLLFGRWLV